MSDKRRRSRRVQPGTKPAPKWAQRVAVPTPQQLAHQEGLGLPADGEIVGSILMGGNLVWGVPEKEELFRQSGCTARRKLNQWGDDNNHDYLRLVYAECAPTSFVRSYPAISDPGGLGIVEHNFILALPVITREMMLCNVTVISGSRTDDSRAIVFEGTEYIGPAFGRRLRVIRVTVHDDSEDPYATYEVVAEAMYPSAFV